MSNERIKDVSKHLDGLMNKIYMPALEKICKQFIVDTVRDELQRMRLRPDGSSMRGK
jgi:hypothetical protein